MDQLLLSAAGTNLFWYFILDLITVITISYGIYFRRYYDRDAVTASVLFNIFVFAVVTVFLNVQGEIGIGFGFGLFAVLSLVTLRSEVLTKTDITFFFGSLSIALINALSIDNFALVIVLNVAIVLAAWIVDHPKILSGVQNTKIMLDHIPTAILKQTPATIEELSKKFGVKIINYRVSDIDQVKDTAKLEIAYKRS